LGDDDCKELISKLSINATTEPGYTLSNRILRFHNEFVVGGNSELKKQIITSMHYSALGGHFREHAT
jgi:hypothetical protein